MATEGNSSSGMDTLANLFSMPKDISFLFNSFLYFMKVIIMLIFLFIVASAISWFMHLDPRQQLLLWSYLAFILSVMFLAQYGLMPCADLPKKDGGGCSSGFSALMSIKPPDKAKYRDKFIIKYLPQIGETILSIGLFNIFFIMFVIIIKGPWWKLLGDPNTREIQDTADQLNKVKDEYEKTDDEVKGIKKYLSKLIKYLPESQLKKIKKIQESKRK